MVCVPASRPAPACCPAPMPRSKPRKKRRAKPRRGLRVDPFLHCVYGPVNYIGEGHRAPDGHSEPSVVVEHRSLFNVTASSNGNITLAIVASPYGCLGVDEGTVTYQSNTADVTGSPPYSYGAATTETFTGTSQGWNPSGGVNHHYSLLPFIETLQQSGNLIEASQQYGLQAAKFRILSTQAKVSYVGNNFYNQGVATTARLSLDLQGNFPATAPGSLSGDAYFLQYGDNVPQILPTSFSSIGALPGARTFSVTQDVNMINPPTSFEFQEMKPAWAPFYSASVPTASKDTIFGGLIYTHLTTGPDTYEFTGNDPVFGLGFAPVTFYAATGLALAANNPISLTVETRTCIEYVLAYQSPSVRFASYPPPERPLAIRQAHDLGRILPSSVPSTPAQESEGWLSRLLQGYWSLEKKGIATGYEVGGKILGAVGGNAIGRLISGLGNMALGNSNRLAIGY